jgi:gliding motility-associated protein GldM
VPWEQAMFESMPVVAVTTLLTKYQSDVRAAESDVVSYLKNQTDASDFRVNKLQAYAFATSGSYIIKGGKYSAQIVLSAVDTTLRNTIEINGRELPENGIYEVGCNSVGHQRYSGTLWVEKNGLKTPYPFSSEYTVGEPQATVSNSDLNVVYRGIDNKFDISVPGVPASQVSVSVDGGSATKTGEGKYTIRANRDSEIIISVSATIEGKSMSMGKSPFRVKYLPDPKSFLQYTDAAGVVRQIQDASVAKKLLKGGSIVASYGPDELVKARFDVLSFNMVTVLGSSSSSGSALSSKQLSDIDRLEGGDNITFKNIKAKGPDGKVRDLPPVAVKL